MCIPKAPEPGAVPAAVVPSQQSANSLQLGGQGVSRGASALGRLALRLGGSSSSRSAAVSPTSAAGQAQTTSSAPPAATTTVDAPVPASSAPATSPGAADLRGVYRRVPNEGLRLPL